MYPRSIPIYALVLSSLVAAACGGPDGATCVSGQAVACACTDGRMGAQTCQPDGSFGACACDAPAPSGDSAPTADMAPAHGGPRYVFVTELTYSASAAPSVCQNVAEAAGLPGRYRAWLSRRYANRNYHAIDEIEGDGPWTLVTGEVAFANHGQLATTPSVPINVTEKGNLVTMDGAVWTGTALGGIGSGYDCGAWSLDDNLTVTIGNAFNAAAWTDFYTGSCGNTARVYCFSVD